MPDTQAEQWNQQPLKQPTASDGTAAGAAQPGTGPACQIRRFPEKGMCSNSYWLEVGRHRLLIDPSQPLPEGLGKPTAILCTHGHFDHIAALDHLRSTDCPVMISQADADFLSEPKLNLGPLFGQEGLFLPADQLVTDGEITEFSPDLSLEWRLTPGHTPGSTCLLLRVGGQPQAMFTGDTLFCDSIGRTDFPGGSSREMAASLQKLKGWLKELPPDLLLYPGHGPTTTAGRELQYNIFLQKV